MSPGQSRLRGVKATPSLPAATLQAQLQPCSTRDKPARSEGNRVQEDAPCARTRSPDAGRKEHQRLSQVVLDSFCFSCSHCRNVCVIWHSAAENCNARAQLLE